MAELKSNEKIFTVPLRVVYKKSVKKRTPYAARYVREFLAKHTKAEKVKLGSELNQALWERGIKKPPRKLRVKTVLEDGVVKAELVGFEYTDFRAQPKKEKKGAREKLMERLGPKALKKEEEEKAIEGKKETEPKIAEPKPGEKTEHTPRKSDK